jgi:hypothetical protein
VAETSKVSGNLVVSGNLKAGSFDMPANSVGDTEMTAARPADVDKVLHLHQHVYAQNRSAAVATERKAAFVAYADGVVLDVTAAVTQAAVGDSTVTVDVYKNGASILSSVLTFDSGDAAFASQSAALSSPGYSAGQVVEVVVTSTPGTGTPPRGLAVTVTAKEASA